MLNASGNGINSQGLPEKEFQNRLTPTPKQSDTRGQYSPARQRGSSLFFRTGHRQFLSHPHRLKISHSDEYQCGTDPQTTNQRLQPCPTSDAETLNMAQTGGYPYEALGTSEDPAGNSGLRLAYPAEIPHGQEHIKRRKRLHNQAC